MTDFRPLHVRQADLARSNDHNEQHDLPDHEALTVFEVSPIRRALDSGVILFADEVAAR